MKEKTASIYFRYEGKQKIQKQSEKKNMEANRSKNKNTEAKNQSEKKIPEAKLRVKKNIKAKRILQK
jgi:hypothetical protein